MLVVSLLFALLQVSSCDEYRYETSGHIETEDWFSLVDSVEPDKLAELLTSFLQSSDSVFDYKLYRSPSSEGIGYLQARNLCLELDSFPAIILTERQHAEVCLLTGSPFN